MVSNARLDTIYMEKRITAATVETLAAQETVFDNEVRGFMARRRGCDPTR